ncbi:transmembrane protein 126 [Osmia lignaria lignaria]|uniref:transmembrane protein 126 n=1 Tax=Osmia lignaria lignaria TaxID=1437193 RepID=UPI001478D67F|nr:transmembrane protein 126A [Osmia lignaria]
MALVPGRKDTFIDQNVKDGLNLSQMEAIEVQKKLIDEWEPKNEVMALQYGSFIVGTTSSVSAQMINSIFRRKLKLRSTGQFITSFGLMIASGGMALIGHELLITNDILLYKNQCPVCYEMKASLLLNGTGILYPLLLAPSLNLAIAGSVGLRTPHIYEVKQVVGFWWNVVKPAINHISLAFCINSVIASLVVYKQHGQMNNIANILKRIEEKQSENSLT